jgi:hypothetical protein
MEEKKEIKHERKREPAREVAREAFSLEKKAQAILDSKMPEDQKQAYLKSIGWTKEPSHHGKVTFATYAKIRKVTKDRLSALAHYPQAKSVKMATLEEWDNIFKNF